MPECLFQIHQIAQIAEHMFKEKRHDLIRMLKKVAKYAPGNRVRLNIPKLLAKILRIVRFFDAPFANNADQST